MSLLITVYTVYNYVHCQVNGGGSFLPRDSETPEPIQLKFCTIANVCYPTLYHLYANYGSRRERD